MAKGKQLSITTDHGCPYCKGTRSHSKSQRHRCKVGMLTSTSMRGFSMIELVMSIGILVILGVVFAACIAFIHYIAVMMGMV